MTHIKIKFPCGYEFEATTGMFETMRIKSYTCPLHGIKCNKILGKKVKRK
jgi:hypothetical protein